MANDRPRLAANDNYCDSDRAAVARANRWPLVEDMLSPAWPDMVERQLLLETVRDIYRLSSWTIERAEALTSPGTAWRDGEGRSGSLFNAAAMQPAEQYADVMKKLRGLRKACGEFWTPVDESVNHGAELREFAPPGTPNRAKASEGRAVVRAGLLRAFTHMSDVRLAAHDNDNLPAAYRLAS